jgi:hypothetical protein
MAVILVLVSELLTIGRLTLVPVNHVAFFGNRAMHSFTRAPVTLAAIAAMTVFLSGCIALDAVGGVADAGVPVVTTTGDIVTSPIAD